MPRGGKRSGAGAPKRNLNALKTGDRSVQVAAVRALMSTPSIQHVFRQLRQRQRRREQQLQSILDEIAERDRRSQTINQKASSADSEEA